MTRPKDLLRSIQYAPYGLSLPEILQHHQVARRTAQRWLHQLVDEGRISTQGKARACRYTAVQIPNAVMVAEDKAPAMPFPVSPDSQDILAYISRPQSERHPVHYQHGFLDDYQPNQTWYLPAALRRQLHKQGNTEQAELPTGTYGRTILNRLLIDLSWASSHLEGNTYSWLDTRALIEQGRVSTTKTTEETRMILNHKTAIRMMVEHTETLSFDRYSIFNLHSALAAGLLPDARDEGCIRQIPVSIGQSVYRPLSIPARLDETLDLVLAKAEQISDPFEQSFFIMVHLPYLQPFADVNKRTSRLAANLPLIKANLCPLTFLNIPPQVYVRATLGVYEMTRIELLRDLYTSAYAYSAQEYLTVKRELANPEPLGIIYQDLIYNTVHDVVVRPDREVLTLIEQQLAGQVDATDYEDVRALVIEALRYLHEGVLMRYRLVPADLAQWRQRQRVID